MWHRWIGWKIPLCKWHTCWMAPWLICCFIVILFYIERKCLLMRNLVTVLLLKTKFLENFSVSMLLVVEVLKCWKIVEFPKISKMKDYNIFYETQRVSWNYSGTHYHFTKNSQTKHFVHGNESFKTQTKVKLFLNWLSTQQLFLNLQGIIANNLKTQ